MRAWPLLKSNLIQVPLLGHQVSQVLLVRTLGSPWSPQGPLTLPGLPTLHSQPRLPPHSQPPQFLKKKKKNQEKRNDHFVEANRDLLGADKFFSPGVGGTMGRQIKISGLKCGYRGC